MIPLAFQTVCIASVVLAAFVCLYHLLLAAVGLLTWHKLERQSEAPVHSFAIVIPAHDEQGTVHIALDACNHLDYPPGKITVYVVADNCADQTEEVSRQHGAVCLVRNDPEQPGKGQALEWAFPRILADGKDAVVILDADCTIEAHALRVFDHCLTSGDRVLQANDVVANPDASPVSYVLALGGFVANALFHAPKSALGMPVLLIGSGIVLHRQVLLRFPWQARSLCEDTEYALLLQRHGVPSRFVSSVRVASDFPINREQMVVQRRRWIRGGMHAAWNHGLKLMWEGLKTRNLRLIDAGFTSVIVSRPLIIGQLILSVALAILCQWLVPGTLSRGILVLLGATVVLYFLYAAAGVWLLGLTMRRLGLLLQSPLVILRYLTLSLTTMLFSRSGNWDRTPRIEQPSEIRESPTQR